MTNGQVLGVASVSFIIGDILLRHTQRSPSPSLSPYSLGKSTSPLIFFLLSTSLHTPTWALLSTWLPSPLTMDGCFWQGWGMCVSLPNSFIVLFSHAWVGFLLSCYQGGVQQQSVDLIHIKWGCNWKQSGWSVPFLEKPFMRQNFVMVHLWFKGAATDLNKIK